MKIEKTAENAITVTFNSEHYLFMGDEKDFDADSLESVFRAIAQVHIT